MDAKLLGLLVLNMLVAHVQGTNVSLYEHLFDPKKYSNHVRPAVKAHAAINVTFGLALHEIIDLNDKQQRLDLRTTIREYWFDSSLSWNKSEFGGIEDITVPSEKIWIPDIVLYNNAGEGFGDGAMRTQAIIRHDGLVRLNIPSILKSTCKVHLSNYPFDEQHCSIKFGSWTFDGSQVGLVLESSSADLTSFIPNIEWKLLKIPGEFHSVTYLCCPNPYHDIQFYVNIKRRSLFHAMYLIIPCAVISLLTLLMFLLPPECSERITVGMAILVGLSFFFLLVAENMPATSDSVPVIGIYYFVTLLEVSAAFFMTCIVLICHHHNPTHGDLPDWVRKYMRRPARFLGFPFEVKQEAVAEGTTVQASPGQINEGFTDSVITQQDKGPSPSRKSDKDRKEKDANRILKEHMAKQDVLEKRQEDWQVLALVLNSFFMWIYVIAVVTTIVVILLPQFISAM